MIIAPLQAVKAAPKTSALVPGNSCYHPVAIERIRQ